MLLSIVIPTYNRARLLSRALQSVFSQTFQNFGEVIVVDDFSSDNTGLIVKQWQKKDDRVKYIRNLQNQGVANSRNIGIKEAQGELIAFLDDDDEWLANKLEKQIKLFQDPVVGFVSSSAWVVYGKKNKREYYRLSRFRFDKVSLLVHYPLLSESGKIYRKSALEEVGGFDSGILVVDDWDLVLRLVFSGYQFKFIDEPLYKHYITGENTSSPYNWRQCAAGRQSIFLKYKDYYLNNPRLYSQRLRYDGTFYALRGEMSLARQCFWEGIKKHPLNLSNYLHLLASIAGARFYSLADQIKSKFLPVIFSVFLMSGRK